MVVKFLKYFLVFCIFNGFFAGAWAQEKSLEGVKKSVEADLKTSIRNLAKLREKIANEKIPLAKTLNKSEAEIRTLREKALRFQSIRDSRTLGLDDIRKESESWQNENTYVVNLLNEYALYFENSLNVSEFSIYKDELEAYRVLDKTKRAEIVLKLR